MASGQVINMNKSKITYSPNVDAVLRGEIQCLLGLEGAYLGLPTFIGKNKKATFNMIQD